MTNQLETVIISVPVAPAPGPALCGSGKDDDASQEEASEKCQVRLFDV